MSVYVNPIANGILVSLLIIYLAFIPLFIHEYRKYGTLRMRGNIVIASFIFYMITAWFMTLLPLPTFESVNNMEPIQPNFRPFLFVNTFIKSNPGFDILKPGTWLNAFCSASFFTVAFNVVLTIPFGVYIRKYFKLSLPLVTLLGFLLSLFYEITQYTGIYGIYSQGYRFADVDDLITNTLGAMIGYFFANYLGGILPNPDKDHEITTERASFFRRLLALLVDIILADSIFYVSKEVLDLVVAHKEWDFVIFLIVEAFVFLVIPLMTKKKQTIGMLALRVSLTDKNGQRVQTSKVILHNLFVGMWLHFIHGMEGLIPFYPIEMLFQLLFIIWLLVMIVKSIRYKKICYFWEPWFDTYLKAYNS